jgi:hypothetical protein
LLLLLAVCIAYVVRRRRRAAGRLRPQQGHEMAARPVLARVAGGDVGVPDSQGPAQQADDAKAAPGVERYTLHDSADLYTSASRPYARAETSRSIAYMHVDGRDAALVDGGEAIYVIPTEESPGVHESALSGPHARSQDAHRPLLFGQAGSSSNDGLPSHRPNAIYERDGNVFTVPMSTGFAARDLIATLPMQRNPLYAGWAGTEDGAGLQAPNDSQVYQEPAEAVLSLVRNPMYVGVGSSKS